MMRNGPLALLFHGLVVAFVLAPLVVICLVAFTPENTLSMPNFLNPTKGFSLRWFAAIFEHPDFVTSFQNSLLLALASATLAVIIAVPAGLAIDRHSFPGRDALNALFLSPLIIPHLVLGVAFLRLFALVGATGSFPWLVASHVIIITPYVLRLVLAALSGLDRSVEAAALTLGAVGVWVGTRFIATPEAQAVAGYKERILASAEDGTIITRAYTGKTCRVLRTGYARAFEESGGVPEPFPMQYVRSVEDGANHLGGDVDTPGVDPDREFMPAGQAIGESEFYGLMVHDGRFQLLIEEIR